MARPTHKLVYNELVNFSIIPSKKYVTIIDTITHTYFETHYLKKVNETNFEEYFKKRFNGYSKTNLEYVATKIKQNVNDLEYYKNGFYENHNISINTITKSHSIRYDFTTDYIPQFDTVLTKIQESIENDKTLINQLLQEYEPRKSAIFDYITSSI